MRDMTKECRACEFFNNGKCTNEVVKEKLDVEDDIRVRRDFGCVFQEFSFSKFEKYIKHIYNLMKLEQNMFDDKDKKVFTFGENQEVVVYRIQDVGKYYDIQLLIRIGSQLKCGVQFGIERGTFKVIGTVIDDGVAFTRIYNNLITPGHLIMMRDEDK